MRKFQAKKGTMAIMIVIAAGMLAIGAAEARTSADKQVTVPYADLNLQRPAGLKTLYQRLQQAARQACDNYAMDAVKSLAIKADARNCYRTALTGAVAGMNNQDLNRLHNKTL